MLNVIISLRWLRRLYVVVGVVNTILLGLLALILSRRMAPGVMTVQELDPLHQLDLQAEGGVVAVWYSSALLLLVAVVAVANYWSDQSTRSATQTRWSGFRYGWLVLAAGVLYLSVDEAAQLHEGLGMWAAKRQVIPVAGLAHAGDIFGWLLVLAPVFLLGALFFLGFFAYWLTPVPRARILASIGMCCWVAVPAMEVVEVWLTRRFGTEIAGAGRFVEESLEIAGATLLFVAATEYLIARGLPASEALAEMPPQAGRIAMLVGTAAPLVLIPLAGLGLIVDADLRASLANLGYRASAYRIAHVIETEQPEGHWVIVSGGCDLGRFQSHFRFGIQSRGKLAGYPDGAEPGVFPNYELVALELGAGEPPEQIAASSARVAMMSTHLWHLSCGDATESDRVVEAWLSQRFPEVERLWLPGAPAVALTHVAPTIPPPQVDLGYQPDSAAVFGDREIELLRYEWFPDRLADKTVLRVVLLWQALDAIKTDYHVFVHLVDREGRLVAQKDGAPVYDRYPFSQWAPGQVVVDSYDVAVPPGLSIADAEIRVGLYDFDTGRRLLVGDSDHIKLKRSDGLSMR